MKIAIFFGGRIFTRNIEKALRHLREIKNKYNVTFFMSLNRSACEDIAYIERFAKELDVKYQILDTSTPHELREYERTSHRYTLYSMFYHNYQCFQMIKESGINFDVVVKYRGDFDSNEVLDIKEINPTTLYIPYGCDYYGLNDQIAYGSMYTMGIYCNLINNIVNVLEKKPIYKPESVLLNYIAPIVIGRQLAVKRFKYHYYIYR